jgi:rhodanese-related sulfurtransferase
MEITDCESMKIHKLVILHALWQIPVILLIALSIGLGFNYYRDNPLPLVCSWSDPKVEGLFISLTEAAFLFQQNKAVFLDARPEMFYNEGHIKGALSLPWNEVDAKCMDVIDRIPLDAIIITYCDGPACNLSDMLAEFMMNMGFEDVHVLVNGWTVWRDNELPIEAS